MKHQSQQLLAAGALGAEAIRRKRKDRRQRNGFDTKKIFRN
jgi:hypothetical protein